MTSNFAVKDKIQERLRQLPAISTLLTYMSCEAETWGHMRLTESLRRHVSKLRDEILSGGSPDLRVETIKHAVVEAVADDSGSTLVTVFKLLF